MRRRTMGLATALLLVGLLGYGAQAVIPEVGTAPAAPAGVDGSYWSTALGDPERSAAALEAVLERPDAAAVLAPIAHDRRSETTARGWAIVGLSRVGTASAEATLQGIADDANEPMILRTWAAAGLASRASSFEVLAGVATKYPFPGMERPLTLRAAAVLKGASVASLLEASSNSSLRQMVQDQLLAASPAELVPLVYTDNRDPIRRQAAAYAATVATQRKDPEVQRLVLDQIRFRTGRGVPWEGGALYIPSASWEGAQAKTLVNTLAQWWLYLDGNGKQDQTRQVWNNLYSVGLLQQAGYDRNIQANARSIVEGLVYANGAATAKKLLSATNRSDQSALLELIQ